PHGRPSSVTDATPYSAPCGFSTRMRYFDAPKRKTTSNSGQAAGMQGVIVSRSPWRWTPRIDSTATRYSHAAEPVYHDHPPRPVCGGAPYTSPAVTYGSIL